MTQKRGLGNHGSSAGFKARVSCRPIFWFRVLMHHRYRVHARAETGFYLLCIRLLLGESEIPPWHPAARVFREMG